MVRWLSGALGQCIAQPSGDPIHEAHKRIARLVGWCCDGIPTRNVGHDPEKVIQTDIEGSKCQSLDAEVVRVQRTFI